MFGYVLLGGNKLKAFFWETESPKWYECVVLYSEEAVQHQVVSLHFKVLAERAFLDAQVETELTLQDSQIVSECKDKLSKSLRIPRRVQFSDVEFINDVSMSEFVMELEVEKMLADGSCSSEDELMFSDEEEFFDQGMFYQAEVFGDRFVDEPEEEDFFSQKRNSSIRNHMLETIMSGVPSPFLPENTDPSLVICNSAPIESPFAPFTPLGALAPTGSDLEFWELELEDSSDEEEEAEDVVNMEQDLLLDRPQRHIRVASAPTMTHCLPNILERKPAFISTKGKEKEIWQTYRAEITNTWRAELSELRRELCNFE